MAPALPGYTLDSFTALGVTRDLYRTGAGPAVIVLAEMPGITPKVAEFGQRVAEIGCSVAIPQLFGTPGVAPSTGAFLKSFARACISREFAVFATGRTSPVTDWLRALARAEHARCGGPGVGAVGMCFTGNITLAMAADGPVIAPVLSQPSLPLPLPWNRAAASAATGVSDIDLARAGANLAAAGSCALGLRFTGDSFVPDARFATLRARLGDRFEAVEIDSGPGNAHGFGPKAHSVLTEELRDEAGHPTRDAFDRVIELFRRTLLVGSAPA